MEWWSGQPGQLTQSCGKRWGGSGEEVNSGRERKFEYLFVESLIADSEGHVVMSQTVP